MSVVESESIVLKSYNLAEADRIVVFLTHEHGIVRGVAKGAKRLKSRFGGGLEPFSIVRLAYFQKEALELVSIRSVELIKSYFSAAAEPDFLQKFAYLFELLLAVTPPQDPNKDLYRMVRACLEASAESTGNLQSIGLYFELWLMRLGGYLPDWSKCDECKHDLVAGGDAFLQANFHLLCQNCCQALGQTSVTSSQRALFAKALHLSPRKFSEIARNSDAEMKVISQIFRRIISHMSGREVAGEKSLALRA
jgi:DNA repair protein RecO (recombination protein O)